MSPITVTHPDAGDFKSGSLAWEVLNPTAEHRAIDEIDLTDCPHLKPYSVACLCALARLQAPKPALSLPVEPRCMEHLQRIGIGEFFDCHVGASPRARETNIAVRQLEDKPVDFSSKAMSVWSRELGGAPAGLESQLADHLDEVILNALTHSESPIGCVVAGQAFPQTEKVEVAVVDLGQTILGHLAKHPDHQGLRDDTEAIRSATEEGVTGAMGRYHPSEPHSGAGLHELRRFCEEGGGEMTILSGRAWVVFGANQDPHVREFRGGFRGCLVNLRFSTSPGLTLPSADHIVW